MKNNQGFTLIEMVIVITIIAIMAGLAYPSLMAYRTHHAESERASHEIMVNKALKQYYALTGLYPHLGPVTDYTPLASPTPYRLTPAGLIKLRDELVKITGVLPDIATYHYNYTDNLGNADLSFLQITQK